MSKTILSFPLRVANNSAANVKMPVFRILDARTIQLSQGDTFKSVLNLHIVGTDIAEDVTNVAWTATSATLDLTSGSHLGGGAVLWTATPRTGLAVTSSGNSAYTFSPTNSTSGEYTVRAASSLLPDMRDECVVRVVKEDVVPTQKNHWRKTQCPVLI